MIKEHSCLSNKCLAYSLLDYYHNLPEHRSQHDQIPDPAT